MPDRFVATEAVIKVVEKLNGRKGFDDWWDSVELEVKGEILDELRDTIHDTLITEGVPAEHLT